MELKSSFELKLPKSSGELKGIDLFPSLLYYTIERKHERDLLLERVC